MRPGGVREATVPDDGAAAPGPAVTRWAASGDFEAFVRARHRALLRFAHALTGDAELAADLVQDALVRTGLVWSRVRRRDDPEGYVRRVVATRYVSWWRLLRRERLVAAVPEAADNTPTASGPDETLWRLLATLPPKQRAVIVLRFYEDLTEVEVARVLDCSVGTVKSNGSRGAGPTATGVDGGRRAVTDPLEQDLRRVLHDPRRSPTPAPDIVERVRTGMARRRARRRTAAATAAVLTVVVVAGVSAMLTRDVRPASPGVVPWLDAPVAPYRPPPPATVSPRPTATACRGADLRLAGVDREGATGHTGTFVHVENTGRSRCTLSGAPELTGLTGTGARVRIAAERGTFFDYPPQTQQRPATIDPQEQATLTIETSYTCEGGAPASTTTYRRVQIRLPDGATFDIADRLDSSCPFGIGTWYRTVPQPLEPPEPWPTLRARLEGVPATVHAGQPFDYVVELANTGPAAVTLSPCPAYAEALGGTRADYRLNCEAVPVVPAFGSVRFAMRLHVVRDVPSGPTKMLWSLHASAVAAGTSVTVIR